MKDSCKAYECHFERQNGTVGYDILIAKNEIEAAKILDIKFSEIIREKTIFKVLDFDRVIINDLTAGDLLRLIGKR